MKSSLGLRLPNPVPAPTLSDCCPKRKGSFPKIWNLHPLKMGLSTRSRSAAPPWIPGKGPTATRPWGPCSRQASLPSECSLMSGGLAPGYPGLACKSPLPHAQSCSQGGRKQAGVQWGSCSLLLTAPSFPCSEFQVQAPARGALGRVYPGSRGSEKHSPDSACSVDYSSSRLSSPEHPNEGEAAAPREGQDHAGRGLRWEWRLWRQMGAA